MLTKVGGSRPMIQTHHSDSQTMFLIKHHLASKQLTQCSDKLSIQCFIICLHLLNVYYADKILCHRKIKLCVTSIYSMPAMWQAQIFPAE